MEDVEPIHYGYNFDWLTTHLCRVAVALKLRSKLVFLGHDDLQMNLREHLARDGGEGLDCDVIQLARDAADAGKFIDLEQEANVETVGAACLDAISI